MAYHQRRVLGAVAVAMIGLTACSSSTAQKTTPETTAHSAVQTALNEFFAGHDPDKYRNRRSVLVSVGDDVLVEEYHESSPSTPINIQSVGKSIISSLIGIALAEGRLKGVDQTLDELLPSSAQAMTPKLRRTTLNQVLTMSAGLPPDDVFYAEVFEAPDWVRHIVTRAPGRQGEFEYSSAGSHLLSAILRQATGRSTLEYAKEKLFDPLGMTTTPATEYVVGAGPVEIYEKATNFVWPVDPQGVHVGGGGQKFTARDLLKLGRLWLDEGRRQGRQIVPANWMKQATGARVETGQYLAPGYGYQFWVTQAHGHAAFAALGYGGQIVEVVPDLDLVVVVQSHSPADPTAHVDPGTAQSLDYADLVDQVIAPAVD